MGWSVDFFGIVTVGTTSDAGSFNGVRKCSALDSSAKYASHPEESRIFILYLYLT